MKRTIIILILLVILILSVNITTMVYASKSGSCSMDVRVQGLGNNSGILVKAHDYNGGPIFSCTTNSSGECVIYGLSEGLTYKVGPSVTPAQTCPTITDAVCNHDSWYVFSCTE